MTIDAARRCIAFDGDTCIADGPLAEVAVEAKRSLSRSSNPRLLVFDATTSRPVELDLRGDLDEVRERYAGDSAETASEPPPRRGRPRLGVVSKEVTLLPRHWAWLGTQPGGASATLRRLVEHARKDQSGSDRIRQAQDATYRFLHVVAGDRPGYEEALRALFAGDGDLFRRESERWPADLRDHARRLAAPVFDPSTDQREAP